MPGGKHRIVIRGPVGPPMTYLLGDSEVILGRSSSCHIILEDLGVSRRHARIFRQGSQWRVEDLDSLNGVYLNGEPVDETVTLRPGDELLLGETKVVFRSAATKVGSADAGQDTDEIRWSRPGPERVPREMRIVGETQAIRDVLDKVERVAPTEATVLITGESGTGKELVAREIHRRSDRRDAPFTVINCPALPGALLESELFGVEKGVATGVEARKGRLETAEGGTILLDEVGDLSREAQAKVLRTLQERTFERVGGRESLPLNVRFLAATHHDLEQDVEDGSFRLDLYHRLNVFRIEMPPLRERLEDVPLLVEHFVRSQTGREVPISDEAIEMLRGYTYPGNIRELGYLVERALILSDGDKLTAEHLTADLLRSSPRRPAGPARGDDAAIDDAYRAIVEEGESFWEAVKQPYLERHFSRDQVRSLVERLYRESGGSYKELARRLRMDEAGYRRLLNFLNHHDLTVSR